MARYVDGFVFPVSKKSVPAYRRMARAFARIAREHGALEVRECVGDDLNVKGTARFPRVAGARSGETVVFSWIAYRSRAHRDRVNAKIVNDPRFAKISSQGVDIDPKRMAYGGFKTVVDL